PRFGVSGFAPGPGRSRVPEPGERQANCRRLSWKIRGKARTGNRQLRASGAHELPWPGGHRRERRPWWQSMRYFLLQSAALPLESPAGEGGVVRIEVALSGCPGPLLQPDVDLHVGDSCEETLGLRADLWRARLCACPHRERLARVRAFGNQDILCRFLPGK